MDIQAVDPEKVPWVSGMGYGGAGPPTLPLLEQDAARRWLTRPTAGRVFRALPFIMVSDVGNKAEELLNFLITYSLLTSP